jgi:4'-phosphopantetheinyl transferase
LKEVEALEDDLKRRLSNSWSRPSSPAKCPIAHVDIWKVRLDQPEKLASRSNNLSCDEIARASRFHFERDQDRFVRCRSVLRDILADYLEIPGSEIRFEYLKGGKPQVVASQNPRALQFNLSHSTNVALIAVSGEYRLGVDVERIREDVDTVALAERFFSLRERAGLRALPAQLQLLGFFACWTRKEAFLKATGDGLAFPLADFSVATHPDSDPRLEEIKGDTRVRDKWFLADVDVGDVYRASVAIEATSCRLETYAWN